MQTNNLFKDKRGDASTTMMIFCPLEELESTNSHEDQTFITSYKISISNDGQNFGEEEDIFIFNSTFRYFEEIAHDGELKFFLKVIFRHNLYKITILVLINFKKKIVFVFAVLLFFLKLCQGVFVTL